MLETTESIWKLRLPLPTQDDLPSEDGVPMETERHKKQMDLLIYSLAPWLKERGYVSGNMFVYFSANQLKNEDFRGPDVFVALGVSNQERKSWVVWEEGKAPDIVIELLSEKTAKEDKGKKKQIYQDKLRVPEYYWFDPFNVEDWAGFELKRGIRYERMSPDAKNRLVSGSLDLALTRWHGVYEGIEAVWLRWETLSGELLPTPQEMSQAAQQQAEAEARRANSAEQRANTAFSDGEQQKALETARKMLADGLDSATVMKYTGLSHDELRAL
jgi:Uma2 family endonuclease